MGLCIWSDRKVHHSENSLVLELSFELYREYSYVDMKHKACLWTGRMCKDGSLMGNEFFSSDNLKDLITLPSWYLTSLPPLYSSGSSENSHPGNIWKKGFCAHRKIPTLVLAVWSLYCESCAILMCKFNVLFIYKYMTCVLAICFFTVVQ